MIAGNRSTCAAHCLVSLIAMSAMARGQAETRVITADAPGTEFGICIVSVGDLDGDGWGEIAVGEPRAVVDDSHTGRVRIYSLGTMGVAREIIGPVADRECNFGMDLAAGIVDGKQVLLVAARVLAREFGYGYVALFDLISDSPPVIMSGKSMELLVRGPVAAVRLGDSAPVRAWAVHGEDDGAGAVCQLAPDLSTTLSIVRYPSATPDCTFGITLDGTGDVDGDGAPDLIVGDPEADGLDGISGRVYGFPCGSNQLKFTMSGAHDDDAGQQVAYLGDLDGDGGDDFAVVGTEHFGTGNGFTATSSGRTGSLLKRFDGLDRHEERGWGALARVPDLDGDGHDDLLISARRLPNGAPIAMVLSSTSGKTLLEAGSGSADGWASWCGGLCLVRSPSGSTVLVHGIWSFEGHGRVEIVPVPGTR